MAVKADDLSPWLSLLAVIFFELGAAGSLIVVAAPVVWQKPVQASAPAPVAEAPTAEAPTEPARRGRKRAKPLDAVVEKIERAGGTLDGSYDALGAKLGLSTSGAYRTLNMLAAMGVIALNASPAGTQIRLL